MQALTAASCIIAEYIQMPFIWAWFQIMDMGNCIHEQNFGEWSSQGSCQWCNTRHVSCGIQANVCNRSRFLSGMHMEDRLHKRLQEVRSCWGRHTWPSYTFVTPRIQNYQISTFGWWEVSLPCTQVWTQIYRTQLPGIDWRHRSWLCRAGSSRYHLHNPREVWFHNTQVERAWWSKVLWWCKHPLDR